LRIVGIVETEPAAGFGGFGRGRVLIPEELAEKLSAAQSTICGISFAAHPAAEPTRALLFE